MPSEGQFLLRRPTFRRGPPTLEFGSAVTRYALLAIGSGTVRKPPIPTWLVRTHRGLLLRPAVACRRSADQECAGPLRALVLGFVALLAVAQSCTPLPPAASPPIATVPAPSVATSLVLVLPPAEPPPPAPMTEPASMATATESTPDAVADRPAEQRGDIQGRLVPMSSEQPLAASIPRAVFARPRHGKHPDTTTSLTWRRVDGAFSPTVLVVCVGQSVHIVNEEEVCHGFFSSSAPNAFDLGLVKPGASSTLCLTQPGTVHVYCSLHAGRQATILVVPSPYFGVVDPAGEFEIKELPPDEYVLETAGEDLGAQPQHVRVRGGGAELVEIPWMLRGQPARD